MGPGWDKIIQLVLGLILEPHELSRSALACGWAQESKKKCTRPPKSQTWNQFNFTSLWLVKNKWQSQLIEGMEK